MDNFQFKRSDRVAQQIQDIVSNILATKVIVPEVAVKSVPTVAVPVVNVS